METKPWQRKIVSLTDIREGESNPMKMGDGTWIVNKYSTEEYKTHREEVLAKREKREQERRSRKEKRMATRLRIAEEKGFSRGKKQLKIAEMKNKLKEEIVKKQKKLEELKE